jgi:hypothetical protein
MRFFMNQLLGLVAGGLVMVTGFAQAAQPVVPVRPAIVPNQPKINFQPMNQPKINFQPVNQPKVNVQYNVGSRPIGWDWWRTYPYSQYNLWRNSYWDATYYPYAPVQMYPYYIVPSVPQPIPIPEPFDIGSSYR